MRPGRDATNSTRGGQHRTRGAFAVAIAMTLTLVLAAAAQGAQRWVGNTGLVVAGEVSCVSACEVIAPNRTKLKIDGRAYWAKVLAPVRLGADGSARVRVRLGAAALGALAGEAAKLRLRLATRADGKRTTQLLELHLRRRAAKEEGAMGDGAGKGSGPTVKSAPLSSEPPRLARPATAVDVSGVKVTWFPRDSWVRYASSGVAPGDGILTAGGAVGTSSNASPCPDRPSSSDAQLPYAIDFAPQPSWYDPVSGSAGVYGTGSATFRWKAHTIDLTASDPEIEIAGSASRAIFRFSGTGGTPYPNQRASLLSLDTAGQPTPSNGGKTLTYSLMRGTLTADGVNVFAGFYAPPDNDEFGCVSVSFNIP